MNVALKIYLGDENGGYQPVGDPEERLRQAYPKEAISAELEKYLYEEIDFAYPCAAASLAEAGEIYAQHLRSKHPELDSKSIKGLANRFTYGWR